MARVLLISERRAFINYRCTKTKSIIENLFFLNLFHMSSLKLMN